MVYSMSGGSRAYDPSLQAEPSNTFQEMDGNILEVVPADVTPDGGGRISKATLHIGRPVKVDDNIPTKLYRTVFAKEKAAGYHMWHDNFLPSGNPFSDELAERLIGAGSTGLTYKLFEEA